MTLPVSGAISFNDINVELGTAGTTQASLNQASYRALAGVPSGAISMSNFYGKSNAFPFNMTAGANVDLRTQALTAGWNGSSKVVATLPSGTIYSNSTGTPALTITGSFPNGVQFVNNGIVIGRGGNGGGGGPCPGGSAQPGGAGGGGGIALSVSVATSITNNGTIAGGGGGGGGGGCYKSGRAISEGGGGGGGIGLSSGGPGGNTGFTYRGSDGSGGTLVSNGGGGGGGNGNNVGNSGGSGGSYGSNGSNGVSSSAGGGGGGAAGSCTSGNVNITWLVTGTRYGPLN